MEKTGRWILALAVAMAASAPLSASSQTDPSLVNCGKRASKALMSYSGDASELITECEVESLNDDVRTDCPNNQDLIEDLDKTVDKARREVQKCSEESLRALCPYDSQTGPNFATTLRSQPGRVTARMQALSSDIFTTPFACELPRPTGEVSREAEDCGDRLSLLFVDGFEEMQKCLFKCELSAMKGSEEVCFNPSDGSTFPGTKVADCAELTLGDILEEIDSRCDVATLRELGCPLGASSVAEVGARLWTRLWLDATTIANEIFRSDCQGGIDPGTEPGVSLPAPATLLPSETLVLLHCGDVLDSAFFGTDTTLRFDGSLDCAGEGLGSHGLIVTASGVTIDGNIDFNLSGPSRSANRTGNGILVGPGADDVTIRRFRAIQRYGAGIGDSGDNGNLTIESVTVRRNKQAGVRVTSPGVLLEAVKGDRNPVNFDVSGDESTILESRSIRAEPAPGIGILLHGTDTNGNGRVVRVTQSAITENMLGILAQEGPQLIEQNEIRENLGDGLELASIGSKAESNSIKLNIGDGVVVSGEGNNVTQNRSDENTGWGYVITGTGNDINGNGSGSLTDQGNALGGYQILAAGNALTNNKAEANLGNGFQVEFSTTQFKSNIATENAGIGFNIASSGNTLDTNNAAANGGHEFSIASNNTDAGGNRRNGSTFAFTSAGGNF